MTTGPALAALCAYWAEGHLSFQGLGWSLDTLGAPRALNQILLECPGTGLGFLLGWARRAQAQKK